MPRLLTRKPVKQKGFSLLSRAVSNRRFRRNYSLVPAKGVSLSQKFPEAFGSKKKIPDAKLIGSEVSLGSGKPEVIYWYAGREKEKGQVKKRK